MSGIATSAITKSNVFTSIDVLSGSNLTIQSGSINTPFGNVTANNFYGNFSGSVTGSITIPSGSNITLLSGSITSPFEGAYFGGNITGSVITGSGGFQTNSTSTFGGAVNVNNQFTVNTTLGFNVISTANSIGGGPILLGGATSVGTIGGGTTAFPLTLYSGSSLIIPSGSITQLQGFISGSGFQTSASSTLGTTTLISGSSLTVLSGSTTHGGNVILNSGSILTVQSGSIRTPTTFGVPGTTAIYRNVSGNITAVSGSTSTALTYDVNGNIITVINTVLGINYTGSVSYDTSGNVTSFVWNN
jgi:hypothetical protein